MRVLVVDIGGTAIKWACMDEESNILERGKVTTPLEGRAELIECLVERSGNTQTLRTAVRTMRCRKSLEVRPVLLRSLQHRLASDGPPVPPTYFRNAPLGSAIAALRTCGCFRESP